MTKNAIKPSQRYYYIFTISSNWHYPVSAYLLCSLQSQVLILIVYTHLQTRTIEASRDEKRREMEERLAREEAQKFEKLMTEGGHRKRKNRRRMSQEVTPSFIQKHKLMVSMVLIIGLLSIVIGIFLKRE